MNAIHRGQQVKLGRPKASPHILGPRRLMASRLMGDLPAPAPSRDWLTAAFAQAGPAGLGVSLNDTESDCTAAAVNHGCQILSANTGTMVSLPDSVVQAVYEKTTGYIPGDASTDQGGIETDVLAGWQAGLPGVPKLDGWIPVNPQNIDHVRKTVERFGFAYVGISLPVTIQDQPTLWTVNLGAGADAAAGSLGGHAVVIGAYDSTSFDICTWGYRVKMSLDFWDCYGDECYAPLCSELWCRGGLSPVGDGPSALLRDLSAVA